MRMSWSDGCTSLLVSLKDPRSPRFLDAKKIEVKGRTTTAPPTVPIYSDVLKYLQIYNAP